MRRSRAYLVFLGLLLLSVLAWRASQEFSISALGPAEDEPEADESQAVPDAAVDAPRSAAPEPGPARRVDAGAAGCLPGTLRRCYRGDVWSLSSCEDLEAKVDECGDRLCRGDACLGPERPVCEEPPEGRCDGQTVVLCRAGQTQRVDCAQRGMSCALGEEGAECVPKIAPDLRCVGAARCEKDVLVRCEAGRLVRTDCGALRSQCLDLKGAHGPSCVRVEAPQASACGPCGCGESGKGEVECDAQDEDGDGHIDEGLDCGPVPVVAFTVTDGRGGGSHTHEDVAAELARVNALFAADDAEMGLSFELDAVIELPVARLLALDSPELTQLMNDPRVHPAREEFYIPIVFTDEVLAGGGTPKYGLSTLPNGTCGGLQGRAGTETGLIVVAKERAPTTVAHEIGHYLGLCHTHAEQSALTQGAVMSASGTPLVCGDMCKAEGDGLCDTPHDPGPPTCSYDPGCDTHCRGGAQPDAKNLMSYYTACRRIFSRDQVRLMQHTVALRRAWQPCIGGACACTFGGHTCPLQMSCRPRVLPELGSVPRCTLDGPRPAASDCEDTGQCGRDAICLQESSRNVKRCVRLCQSAFGGCACTSVGGGLSVCTEDLDAK